MRALTTSTDASPAPDMNCLTPVSTYSSPSAMALVVIAAASDPAPGSVRQYAPRCCMVVSFGSHSRRCASVPFWSIIHATMLWIEM